MSAYLIMQIEWTTPAARMEYVQKLGKMAEEHGGRWLVASSEPKVAEGTWKPGRLVIAEFPTMEKLNEFYDSPEYRPLRELRMKGAKCDTIFVQGA